MIGSKNRWQSVKKSVQCKHYAIQRVMAWANGKLVSGNMVEMIALLDCLRSKHG